LRLVGRQVYRVRIRPHNDAVRIYAQGNASRYMSTTISPTSFTII
jgi:hypothetical protein